MAAYWYADHGGSIRTLDGMYHPWEGEMRAELMKMTEELPIGCNGCPLFNLCRLSFKPHTEEVVSKNY